MEPKVRSVPHPGDISVGPDQYGAGSYDRAKHRNLLNANVFRIDRSNPIRPWRDVEAAEWPMTSSPPNWLNSNAIRTIAPRLYWGRPKRAAMFPQAINERAVVRNNRLADALALRRCGRPATAYDD